MGQSSAPLLLLAVTLHAQTWLQWGQNPSHTGAVSIPGQKPNRILGRFTYGNLADQIRQDTSGDLHVHYMAPLVLEDEVYMMTRGDSQWLSCRDHFPPCGTQLWRRMQWGITKLTSRGGKLQTGWTAMSTWTPPPDNGSAWEPVFHPAIGRYLYLPGAGGTLMEFDRRTGELRYIVSPFAESNPNRYVTSPLTVDAHGSVYYTVMKLDAAQPWSKVAPARELVSRLRER